MIKLYLKIFTIIIMANQMSYAQSYQQIHKAAMVADLHNDAIGEHLNGRSIETYSYRGDVDLERLKIGGVNIAFFSLWPDPRKYRPEKMFERTDQMLNTLLDIISRNSEKVQLLTHPNDLETILSHKKIAIGMGIEGGDAIEGDLKKLDYFYRQGVRYMTLTWNYSNDIASSSHDEQNAANVNFGGLTEFGRTVIRRMNDLGMMIDLSHTGIKTFEQVLKASRVPVIVSHSCVYNICQHHRNLRDWQIKALAEKGGVIFINFSPNFLKKGFAEIYAKARREANSIEDSIQAGTYHKEFDRSTFIHEQIDPIYPSVKDVVDHIDYVVKLVGDDYVGLGSDFDGIPLTPAGLSDMSKMPNITKELLKRNYTQESIKKILGGNFMRVFREICK